MLSQTDAVKQAWAATDRTLDIIVTVDGKDYQATEINSLNYDAGAFTGYTLGIGSTYENSVTIEFSSVVEAFKQGLTVLPKIGILVNGKFEYTKLGTFIISEVNRDRNNNLTTIKALDQMCKLEGQYKPTVSDMASPLDIIADIANQGGVTVNTGELQHLPTLPNIKKIEGQTLRTAIGWVAQLYGGFAAFDRDGKLTIRTTASPDYTITPGEYQQGGLTKNEVSYKTGGIKVTVNTKKTDDSGQEVDDTTTLQAGETTGSQIELTNDSMTSDLLTTVWTGIKDITYYPYTLNWFGNPNLEAGDWVTLTDTQGNQFNVPVNQYTMSFNGGLESTISATQSSSTAGGYAYTGSAGSIKNMIEALQVRHTASGNNVYPPSYQGEPKNPKKGDVWYKQNGNNVEVWIYQEDNGTLAWVRTPIDGEVKADLQALGAKTDEDLTRVKSELSSAAESQWESAKAATSEVASDLSATKASLAAVNNDLSTTKANLEDTRTSLATATNDLTNVKTGLVDTRDSLAETASDLSATKTNLAAVSSDLSATKTNLEDTKNSLSTTAADLQKQTGQLSGSLSTANSKIEFNSNAIAEVSQTADAIRADLTNTQRDVASVKATANAISTDLTNAKGDISSVTQTANAVKTDLVNTKGDVAAVKATADSLTAQMADANGNISQLQQTAKGLQSTVTDQSDKISQLQQDADGLSATVGGAAIDLIPNLDQPFVMGYGIADTTWQDSNSYIQLPTTKANSEVLPKTAGFTLNIPWQAGKTYMQSIIFETDAKVTDGMQWTWFTANGHMLEKTTLVKLGNNTYRLIGSHTPTASEAANPLRVFDILNFTAVVDVTTGTYLKFRNPRIWCPDDNSLAQLKLTADGLTSKVADTQGNVSKLEQTASGLQTQITNTKDDVASVKVTADSVRTDLTNANHDIASVKATADSLTSSMANANDQISTLQQRADSITSTLSNGGVNLLSGTSDFSWPLVWFNNTGTQNQSNQYNDSEKVTEHKCVMTPGQNQGLFWGSDNEVGQTYTLSFDARCDNGKANINPMGLEGNFLVDAPLTTDWTRYHVTVKVTEGNHNWVTYFSTTDADNVYTRKYQIEYGDTATPWKQSNGDITQLKLTADDLTADMKDAKGNISSLQTTAGGLTTRVSNTEHNISSLQETAKELKATVGDDNTGLVSYVKAIPGQISSAITASKQATVITSAVDVHDMKTAGYYLLKGTLSNSPVESWAYLRVITSESGDRIYHQIWKDVSSTVYTEYWAGDWSGWETHINSENLKSNVITAINQSTEGVSITGSKITLDGNVNVTPGFTFSADYIKAGTLSADRISGGTLDFSSNITVKGLTANSISSGSISGQNLNINLDNGVVEFTKGNLHSTDGRFNISIDTKSFYLDMGNDTKLWIDGNGFHLQESATQHLWMDKNGLRNYTDANGNGLWINDTTLKVLNSNNAGLIAKDGMLQFIAEPFWKSGDVYSGTLDSQLYGTIGFNSNLWASSLNGIFIKGREGVMIGTNSYNGGSFFGPGVPLFTGINGGSGINLPERADDPASIFTNSSLTLFAGSAYSDGSYGSFNEMPYISIGCNWYYTHSGAYMTREGTGDRNAQMYAKAKTISFDAMDWINLRSQGGAGRIALDAQYVHSYPTYRQTTSAGANVFVAPDGALIRSSSARKYKTDIQDADNDYGAKLIEFAPQKWIDKVEKKRYEEDPENNKKPGYYYGLIADDLDAAGLDMLVNYGSEGEVEGINYDRLAVALLPVIKSLKDQVAILKEQVKALTK